MGIRLSRAWRYGLAVAAGLVQTACVTGGSGPARYGAWGPRGAPSHYAQSMNSAVDGCLRNPACAVVRPGEEAILPGLSRALEAAEAVATMHSFLEESQVRRIERILVQCAKEADAAVNEQQYGPGRFPDDKECGRSVLDSESKPSTQAQELGKLKHVVAFACVRRELPPEFADKLSIEPRYRADPSTGAWVLTQIKYRSIRPDVVLHAAGNPNQAQCVFDFKFPCTASSKSDPLEFAAPQLSKYDSLHLHCPPAIVTPQLGISP